ncbi:hypothetical protein C9374_008718 [Naegleria lovaniensis]|uniref:Mitochondrial import inner membrane translocase subunit n=1 Tax=Naegleria lovaniensis TaxID=51637 RepID=A0AA88GKF9_NAELO|nr:uncharacterized protein C9374_008718 [Naegleria lovaniensis]KAG2378096.1 hypothetical protein C9374_008718 [Naegleria lovaniensis]
MQAANNPVYRIVATAETPEELEMAKIEAYTLKDNYSLMVKQCFKDCIGLEFKHNDIHAGESICENRCVAKYMEAVDLVKKTLAEIESQEQENNTQ